MKKKLIIPFLMLTFFFSEKFIAQGKAEQVIERFEYEEVRLTGGRLKLQLDQTVDLYLNIPNKDLLKGFRERAGLPAPGAKDLGGWYTNDIFHPFGQYLSGLSRLYAATGNEACRTKLDELIDGWAETVDPDGYFFYTKNPNARHYIYEKMQAGLLDAYLFAGNASALKHMGTITDWAIKNLHPERSYPYIPGQRNVEWYTLSENLYRAYLETGEKKYRNFGMYWEYPEFWNAIRDNKDIFDNKVRYHAYSHLNSLSGAAMAYQVENDKNYLHTLINGYDFFVNQQAYITGGFGPIEQLVSNDDKRIITNFTHNTFETQCGSWAGFKLSKYLLEFTGNGMYGDWIEKLLINGIGASIPMLPTGEVMYYSDYNCQHASKSNYTNQWSCCTGTRPQAIADYGNLIYFKDDKGIYVNYFTPSTVRWDDVVLEQITEFPEESSTTLTVSTTHSKTFDINIRKPLWLEEMTIKVNGKPVKGVEKNGWLTVSRLWKKGDKIEAAMPMDFESKRMHPDHPYPIAMAYGPVTLAVRNAGENYPTSVFDESQPGKNLIPQPGKKLSWRDKNHPEWSVQGFFQLEENEPYVIYVDERAKRVVPNDQIHTSGKWSPRSFYRSASQGSSIATEVSGTGIRIACFKGENGGKFKVEFNGKDAGVIDLYAEGERIVETYDFKDFTSGKQSIKLTVLRENNEKSTGTMVAILGFEKL